MTTIQEKALCKWRKVGQAQASEVLCVMRNAVRYYEVRGGPTPQYSNLPMSDAFQAAADLLAVLGNKQSDAGRDDG